MKPYQPFDWYWIVGNGTTQVYSSKASVRNYVPVTDPDYVAWSKDETKPTIIDTEQNLGAVLAPYLLRPKPQPILDGYLDAQLKQIVIQPEFKIWIDVYSKFMQPVPNETEVKEHMRGLL